LRRAHFHARRLRRHDDAFEVDYFNDEKLISRSPANSTTKPPPQPSAKSIVSARRFAPRNPKRRHLTEFWMVEPEIAYATLDDVMNLCERFLSHIARVLDERSEELKVLERDTAKLEAVVPPFPRLQYDDAVQLYRKAMCAAKWKRASSGVEISARRRKLSFQPIR
jgi:asparaginyl-tRNA synthetase